MVKLLSSFLLSGIILLICSCGANKKLTEQAIYFKNLNDSMLGAMSSPKETVFQKGDILTISFSTANQSSAKLFNQVPITSEATDEASAKGSNFLVGSDGNIILPVIGVVKAEGLTKSALTKLLTEKARLSAEDVIVSIWLQNYKITVLGEVAKPSSYTIPNERVSVLDVIGLAGDLTPFGRRDNIRIIRQNGETRETGTLNLNDGNIFQSPYFYLQQNDIVYVEMNDRKMNNVDQTGMRNLSIIVGILSAISVIAVTISRF